MIKSIKIRSAGHVARMGESRGINGVLIWKSDGHTAIGRTRRRWEDKTKIYFRELGCGGMDLIELG